VRSAYNFIRKPMTKLWKNWIKLASEVQRKQLDVPGLRVESLERFAQMSEERDPLFGSMLARVGL
jgi:hypothetical protein